MNSLYRTARVYLVGGLVTSASRHTCLPRPYHSSTMSTCPTTPLPTSLDHWSFSPPLLANLPLDKETENSIRRSVPGAVFSLVRPTPWQTSPKLVAHSPSVIRDMMDLDPEVVESKDFLDFVAGNLVLPESVPMAHRYGGHQFGSWAGQLGDGRAHMLGEFINRKGERWELQLKGSGRTPYSRFGDGRAVLRSSVREFLCSEAMFGLGVPTSRAATLVVTEDKVPRDMFYDGRVRMERGAVVLRLAPTWFRFGSFEILANNKELSELKQLTDFVLEQTFPHIQERGEEGYLAMFSEVVTQTADMIASWEVVGFTHGVMNTDNLSIGSVTIDYGPFGFVDQYDPNFTPNHSDDMSRYDLQSQANIGLWNLGKLAGALKPLVSVEQQSQLETVLRGYGGRFQSTLQDKYRRKLGLVTNRGEEDDQMVSLLLDTMELVKADFTQTFRDLSELSLDDLEELLIPESAWGVKQLMMSKQAKAFLAQYVSRVRDEGRDDSERMQEMQGTNPRYVLRNWIAQRAVEQAEQDDFSEVRFLLELLYNPYMVNKEAEEKGYAGPPPDWAKRLAVSCSS